MLGRNLILKNEFFLGKAGQSYASNAIISPSCEMGMMTWATYSPLEAQRWPIQEVVNATWRKDNLGKVALLVIVPFWVI